MAFSFMLFSVVRIVDYSLYRVESTNVYYVIQLNRQKLSSGTSSNLRSKYIYSNSPLSNLSSKHLSTGHRFLHLGTQNNQFQVATSRKDHELLYSARRNLKLRARRGSFLWCHSSRDCSKCAITSIPFEPERNELDTGGDRIWLGTLWYLQISCYPFTTREILLYPNINLSAWVSSFRDIVRVQQTTLQLFMAKIYQSTKAWPRSSHQAARIDFSIYSQIEAALSFRIRLGLKHIGIRLRARLFFLFVQMIKKSNNNILSLVDNLCLLYRVIYSM